MIGTLYGTEQFNMSLSIVPDPAGSTIPAVDAAKLSAVASLVATWFQATTTGVGPNFSTDAKLTAIKLNRINSEGHYQDNQAREHIYPTPLTGGVTLASGKPPAQIAHVVTLRTAIERGRGSKGRIYLPIKSEMTLVTADGRIGAAGALQSAMGVRALALSLNTSFAGSGKVGVASNAGAGRFEPVTAFAAGRVLDTMRSRRASLLEDYQEAAL
jgi:hypothetical protein